MNLTDVITSYRGGVLDNPYQGEHKKVLFVCSAGILRSATAARIYAGKYNTRSCGTYDIALIQISSNLVLWADEIVFVNQENYNMFKGMIDDDELFDRLSAKIKVLNIPDKYPHMHPELIKAFEEQYEAI